MRVLYLINAGIMGGRERHVLTLVKSLPKGVEHCICAVSGGEATDAMRDAGLNVKVLGGRSGHDIRIVSRFIRLLREFRPDVVHAHSAAFLPYVVLKWFRRIPLIQSIHGPSNTGEECEARKKSLKWKLKLFMSGLFERKPEYYLPVSKATWDDFKIASPDAQGEVFFNALNLAGLPKAAMKDERGRKIVGMVGRNAPPKDWPSFCRVAAIVSKLRDDIEFWGVGADEPWAKENVGDDAKYVRWFGSRQDARDLIAQMDVFLLTSKYEQLPTTLLESFAIGVPVVGFLPEGGTKEVLELSDKTSALLLPDRDCQHLAEELIRVVDDKKLREQMAAEGRNIVTRRFDMKELCVTQLMGIYDRILRSMRGAS